MSTKTLFDFLSLQDAFTSTVCWMLEAASQGTTTEEGSAGRRLIGHVLQHARALGGASNETTGVQFHHNWMPSWGEGILGKKDKGRTLQMVHCHLKDSRQVSVAFDISSEFLLSTEKLKKFQSAYSSENPESTLIFVHFPACFLLEPSSKSTDLQKISARDLLDVLGPTHSSNHLMAFVAWLSKGLQSFTRCQEDVLAGKNLHEHLFEPIGQWVFMENVFLFNVHLGKVPGKLSQHVARNPLLLSTDFSVREEFSQEHKLLWRLHWKKFEGNLCPLLSFRHHTTGNLSVEAKSGEYKALEQALDTAVVRAARRGSSFRVRKSENSKILADMEFIYIPLDSQLNLEAFKKELAILHQEIHSAIDTVANRIASEAA